MKPMRYNKHWAIMLILLICSVYLLLLFSPRERKNKENAALSNEWSITSLKEFNKRSEKLRNEVDKIAARTKERFIKEDTPLKVIKQSKTIIYNRIDKAGSTTLIKTLQNMAFKNSFFLIGQGTPNLRMLDTSQKKDLADIFCRNKVDIIYTRHLYFTNFTEFGCNISYFNIVRDPVSRFVSRYNWYREVYHMKSAPYFKNQGKEMSANISNCVINNHPECQYHGELTRMLKFFRMDSQIPFFCGEDLECIFLGNREALEIAKENIKKYFIFVGTLEDLDKSHAVMECLMPGLMKNLRREHRRHNRHIHSDHKFAQFLTPEAERVLRERLSLEYELYNFVRERLLAQFDQCERRIRESQR